MMPKTPTLKYLSLAFTLCLYSAISTANCLNAPLPLSCLKTNFDEVYQTNHVFFWKILHASLQEAKHCQSIEKTSEFLGLVSIKTNNAEFNEFFAENIEKLCSSSPECFNKASQKLPQADQDKLKQMLQNPLFIDKKNLPISACLNKITKQSHY